jgi:ABC-type uncharacterized transport system ATPase subunit
VNNVIETSGLWKSFGGIVPAKDITFSVPEGQLRCLIGPNGAGKSTLFKLIAGIERADRGSVRIFGADVTRELSFRRIRRGVGVKLQSNHAYKDLDVKHNMGVGELSSRRRTSGNGKGAGVTRERALELFGIENIIKGNPLVSSLSHAEQQWLEICCAISPEVGLLLLDEPTAGMGVEETEKTGRALRAFQAAGMTIVVVEHDMEFVRAVADYVTILHQGEVFAEGSMSDLAARGDVRDIYLG